MNKMDNKQKKLEGEVRDFGGIRMCFVPHENCTKTCINYLECPKYQRDELK